MQLCYHYWFVSKKKKRINKGEAPTTVCLIEIHFYLWWRAPLAQAWKKYETQQEIQAAAQWRAEVRGWKQDEWQRWCKGMQEPSFPQVMHNSGVWKERQMDQTDEHPSGRSAGSEQWCWAGYEVERHCGVQRQALQTVARATNQRTVFKWIWWQKNHWLLHITGFRNAQTHREQHCQYGYY